MKTVNVDKLRRNAGAYIIFGALLTILGITSVLMSVSATLVSMVFAGAILLAAGFAEGIKVMSSRSLGGAFWRGASAIIYILAGGYLLFNPFESAIGLTLLLSAFFLATGVIRIFAGVLLSGHAPKAGWLAFSGIVNLILAGIIWGQWPVNGLWVIGLLIGVDLTLHGSVWMTIGVAKLKLEKLAERQEKKKEMKREKEKEHNSRQFQELHR
ncbi:MAG: HdeD family acid-resistance protein [Candidatus Obscuribacterales bacterium]